MLNKSILIVSTKSITINIFLKEIINELSKFYKILLATSDIENLNKFKYNKISLLFPLNLFQLINPFYLLYCIIVNRKKIKLSDTYIILVNTPLASHFVRISCIFLNVKIIYFVHGYRFHSKGNFLLNNIFFIIEKFLALFTYAYININKYDYNATKKYFNKKVILVNGVGINTNIKENTFINHKNKNKFIIGYVGAFKKK